MPRKVQRDFERTQTDIDADLKVRIKADQARLKQGQLTREMRRADEQLVFDYLRDLNGAQFDRIMGCEKEAQRGRWARMFGLPCDGVTVNLFAFMDAIRKLLKDNQRVLAGGGDGDLRDAKAKMELEKLEEQIRKLKNESERAEGQHVPIAEIRENMIRLQMQLRTLGEQYARKRNITGHDAQKMLNATLKSFSREIVAMGGESEPKPKPVKKKVAKVKRKRVSNK